MMEETTSGVAGPVGASPDVQAEHLARPLSATEADKTAGSETGMGAEGDDDLTEIAAEYVWVLAPSHAPARRFGLTRGTALISFAAHAVAVTLILIFMRAPPPVARTDETPIEIVEDVPKPPETKPPEVKPSEAKLPEPAKQAPPLPPPPAPVKAATLESPPKADLPQSPAKEAPEPPKPESATEAPGDADKADRAKALQALRDELAALKTQNESLQRQEAQAEADAARDAAATAAQNLAAKAAQDAVAKALGPLPQSFQAVALPGDAADGDEPVTYQQQVFSQLAKARKGEKHVVSPGVAHVMFDVDAGGNIIDVKLDHPSGDAFLDSEAIAIVRRAAPFPPPPPGAQRSFSASMRFFVEN